MAKTVDIRPGVSVLAVLRHLNYRAWYALGEFVDNAVGSFTGHRDGLRRVDGPGSKLRVDIDIDANPPARISIRDNAAGIFEAEGVDSAFVNTFARYDLPHRTDPSVDPDLASYGVVKVLEAPLPGAYPGMPWAPKAAFAALADYYHG